jgi:hypothetical protein
VALTCQVQRADGPCGDVAEYDLLVGCEHGHVALVQACKEHTAEQRQAFAGQKIEGTGARCKHCAAAGTATTITLQRMTNTPARGRC